ncbi:MAG: cupin domain-containing protein [Candidatus Omnitrophica bacterium]|nr:cupin domain-containing protein [Candidatus Omnitrophota bacterium]
MLVRKLKECQEFVAEDTALLRELLNPLKEKLELGYSFAVARVTSGNKTAVHALTYSEVYYIIKGSGVMHVGDEAQTVEPDTIIYIPPHAKQFIENTGKTELEFICIVDPAWRPECEKEV